MDFFKNNKGRSLGGLIGAVSALVFTRYWPQAVPELTSALIIIALIFAGEFLGNYIYKARQK